MPLRIGPGETGFWALMFMKKSPMISNAPLVCSVKRLESFDVQLGMDMLIF